MKVLFTILAALVLPASVFAQAPEKMSYQAVIRNSNEQLVINTQIGIQISILQGSGNGTEVYSELQHPSTNDNGLISIAIGVGDSENNFSDIDWSNGPFFIKTEVDISGGSNYSITGISQLLSVPYAFYAKTADALTSEIEENDPVFGSSVAKDITEDDIDSWNKKLDDYTETQSIADVAAIDNNVNTQLKNLLSPTDDNDAVTKAYVDSLL